MRFSRPIRTICYATFLGGLVVAMGAGRTVTSPALSNTRPQAKVSFTFDDAYNSAFAKAAPLLATYGMAATDYVDTANVGKPGRMTWSQITQLQDRYSWEIGAHSHTHPLMTEIPASRQIQEATTSKRLLADHGITATDFATPYGDYNNAVLATIAKEFASHRGFWDIGFNTSPANDYLLRIQQVQAGVSVSQVKQYIDSAIANKNWLILVFHDIHDRPSTDPEKFEFATADLARIAAYVKRRGIPVVTIQQGITRSDINLFPNPSFEDGLADGWHTNAVDGVAADDDYNGSYPNPQHSVRLSPGDTAVKLFSPTVSVRHHMTYMIRSFLHIQTIISGEVRYAFEEFDRSGKQIGTQHKRTERTATVKDITFTYTPSSPEVSHARLVTHATAGSGITAYADNYQWFPIQ